MRHLQSGGRTLFLPLIGIDHGFRFGLDRLETASLAFERPPGGDKATNGSVRASISLLFDLAIQELSIAAPFVPSPDEIVFLGIKA